MIQLFLNGTEIVPDSSTNIKVIRENPYFTLSDSYTLEISIPLDIYGNRVFFGDIGRIEKAKSYAEYDARLVADNREIMKGQARITQSTNTEVKIQLTTGVSALKMTAVNGDVYIDELDLGDLKPQSYFNDRIDIGHCHNGEDIIGPYSIEGWGVPLRDETNGLQTNVASSIYYGIVISTNHTYIATCPKLLDVAKEITSKLGFRLITSSLPQACHSIYIITGAMSHKIGNKLPHWTVSEFFDELQNFFGCTIEDKGGKVLEMVKLNSYVERTVREVSLVDDFEVDYTEEDDAKGVINSNLEFSMNASDTETVQDDILDSAQETLEFADIGSAMNDFLTNPENKMRTIYNVGGLIYIGWKSDKDYSLKRIAPFNKLNRYNDAQTVSLKISPVHIVEDEVCEIRWNTGVGIGYDKKMNVMLTMPAVNNNQGIIERLFTGGNEENAEEHTLQSLVEGDEELKKNEDKEDIITVAFIDGNDYIVDEVKQTNSVKPIDGKVRLAFTDYAYKVPKQEGKRERWSLSLKKIDNVDFYLGQMHALDWQCARKCKLKGMFEADDIPDPKNIYLIRNKRYACEKIEADLKDGKLNRLMTGYFYEMR